MKLGADRKKIGFLVLLLCAAAYILYVNTSSSPSGPAPEARPARPAANATAQALAPLASSAKQSVPSSSRAAALRGSAQEFRPSYKHKAEDLSKIDPKLRLDLLARVQAVDAAPAERNLFTWGAAAIPAVVKDVVQPKSQAEIEKELAVKAAPPVVPPAPPPPPITLKYYGYVAQRGDGHKRAFFLDGEDILVGSEGDTLKRRYKVVRIGVNSVTLEDTQFKNTQTLQLAEEAAG